MSRTNTGNGRFPVWAGGNNNGGCEGWQIGSALRVCGVNTWINRRDANNYSDVSFGSRHPGGALFVMTDASVQFFAQTINTTTYTYLGGRNDGQVVSFP